MHSFLHYNLSYLSFSGGNCNNDFERDFNRINQLLCSSKEEDNESLSNHPFLLLPQFFEILVTEAQIKISRKSQKQMKITPRSYCHCSCCQMFLKE